MVGQRALFSASYLFHYACSKFTDKTVLLDGIGGTFPDALQAISKRDVMVVMTTNLYARDAVLAAEFARQAGAKIVAITDNRLSPVVPLATELLLVRASGEELFPSIVPVIVTVQALVSLLLADSRPGTVQRAHQGDRLLSFFGAYYERRAKRRD